MKQYIVTEVHPKKSLFDKGRQRFRVKALNTTDAQKIAKSHSLFPDDGVIISVTEAAYRKKYDK